MPDTQARIYEVNGNIYYVLGGEADLELKAMLYTSVVTLCLVCWFLHCFGPVQCRSARHLNEYSNRSSLTRRCLRSCFLVREISILICKLTHFGLFDSGICTDKCTDTVVETYCVMKCSL